MWDFLKDFLNSNGPLIVLGATYLWHLIFGAGSGTSVEDRIAEVAQRAFVKARAVGVDLTVDQVAALAKGIAHAMLERLGLPMKAQLVELVDHELDLVVAREHAIQHDLAARSDALFGAVAQAMKSFLPTGDIPRLDIDIENVATPIGEPTSPLEKTGAAAAGLEKKDKPS